jgi:hypothetical protein
MTWHKLLAPIPEGTSIKLQPVASPELAATTDVSAIAGWLQLTCEMSAGAAGLRHLLVVLDQTGRPISAGDHVLRCSPAGEGLTRYEHESVGGRLEEDGTFNGTYHWMVFVGPDNADEQSDPIEANSRRPTPEEIEALKGLVATMTRSGPLRDGSAS